MFNIFLVFLRTSTILSETLAVELTRGQYPAVVSIYSRGQHQCGGVFISQKYVLTAAHCVSHLIPNTTYIHSGNVDTGNSPTKNSHTLKQILIYPAFNGYTRDYDLALLQLKNPINLNTLYAGYTDIINSDYELRAGGQFAYIVSWEAAKEYKHLKLTVAELWKPENCLPGGILTDNVPMSSDLPLNRDKICAKPYSGECVEDDTAVLFYNETILWGLGNFNENCHNNEKPVIFTNLAIYRDWIDSYRLSKN